jgi:hypothetical protein
MHAVDSLPSARAPDINSSPIVELRQYTLHPGKRDVLIDLFDREFIESQEALGMSVIGQFRDLDDPDRFVWLRGFRDMTARAQGLKAFYGGPVWKQHREVANATMIDSDNVLLLRPARSGSGFSPAGPRPPRDGSNGARAGLVVAGIHSLGERSAVAYIDYVEREVAPALTRLGAVVLAYLVTESSANNFPALPIRERERVVTWFAGFPDGTTNDGMIPGRDQLDVVLPAAPDSKQPMQILRLVPTSRSALTGSSRACATLPVPD